MSISIAPKLVFRNFVEAKVDLMNGRGAEVGFIYIVMLCFISKVFIRQIIVSYCSMAVCGWYFVLFLRVAQSL